MCSIYVLKDIQVNWNGGNLSIWIDRKIKGYILIYDFFKYKFLIYQFFAFEF